MDALFLTLTLTCGCSFSPGHNAASHTGTQSCTLECGYIELCLFTISPALRFCLFRLQYCKLSQDCEERSILPPNTCYCHWYLNEVECGKVSVWAPFIGDSEGHDLFLKAKSFGGYRLHCHHRDWKSGWLKVKRVVNVWSEQLFPRANDKKRVNAQTPSCSWVNMFLLA